VTNSMFLICVCNFVWLNVCIYICGAYCVSNYECIIVCLIECILLCEFNFVCNCECFRVRFRNSTIRMCKPKIS